MIKTSDRILAWIHSGWDLRDLKELFKKSREEEQKLIKKYKKGGEK